MTESSAARPEKKSNFYWGFLFLPKPKREALKAVYGFCRHMDDIVDSGNLEPEEAQRMLDFWREEVDRLYAGKPTRSISIGLVPHVVRYSLPKQAFLDLIAGVEMDLRKNRYESFAELEPYLHGVAVAVGLLCVEIFGYEHSTPEQIRDYARQMGYAFQLTNIIRDVGADLEQGRIYLPLDEMRQAGYSVDELLHRQHTPAFRSLMEFQYERAKLCYRRAKNLLSPLDRVSMIPAEAMARVYEGVLDRIKEEEYRVFFQRVSLPAWRKARLAFDAWAYSHGFVPNI